LWLGLYNAAYESKTPEQLSVQISLL